MGGDWLGFKLDNGNTSEWILGFDDFTKKKEKFSLPHCATMWTFFFSSTRREHDDLYAQRLSVFFYSIFFKLYINVQNTAFSLTKGFMWCGWEGGK